MYVCGLVWGGVGQGVCAWSSVGWGWARCVCGLVLLGRVYVLVWGGVGQGVCVWSSVGWGWARCMCVV